MQFACNPTYKWLIALSLGACTFPARGAASSLIYDFSLAGSTITAAGVLTVSSAGVITGMTGSYNSAPITALFPPNGYAGNDDLFSPTSPYLDFSGLSFSAAGLDYNLFYDNGQNNCESAPNYYLFVQQSSTSQSCGPTVDKPVSFTLTPITSQTPEPSTAAITLAAGAWLLLLRRGRH